MRAKAAALGIAVATEGMVVMGVLVGTDAYIEARGIPGGTRQQPPP